jgi:hypothetical protein
MQPYANANENENKNDSTGNHRSEEFVARARPVSRNGKISIRLGPVRDVRDWLNNYEAFEKSPVVIIDAIGVRLEGNELQIDCDLDDYAA